MPGLGAPYVRGLGGPTERLLFGVDGVSAPDEESTLLDADASGVTVLHVTSASNLVAGDEVGSTDLFVTNTLTGEHHRAVDTDGEPFAQPVSQARLSADGRYVLIATPEALLPADDDVGVDVYRYALPRWTREHPRDCFAARRAALGSGETPADGEVTIDPDGAGPFPAFEVYCAEMDTPRPAPYLIVDPEDNVSQSRYLNCPDCTFFRRNIERLRLVIDYTPEVRVRVDVRDNVGTTGGTARDGRERASCGLPAPAPCEGWPESEFSNSWIAISSCAFEEPTAQSVGDLRGTPFVFRSDLPSRFGIVGDVFGPMRPSAILDADRKRMTIQFAAGCGGYSIIDWETNPYITLEPE